MYFQQQANYEKLLLLSHFLSGNSFRLSYVQLADYYNITLA